MARKHAATEPTDIAAEPTTPADNQPWLDGAQAAVDTSAPPLLDGEGTSAIVADGGALPVSLAAEHTADLKTAWCRYEERLRELDQVLGAKHAIEDELGRRVAASGKKGVIEIDGRRFQSKKLEKRGGGRYHLVEVTTPAAIDI